MNHSGGAQCRRRKAWTHRRRDYGPPSSPFLHWKFEDDRNTGVVEASARKLAAGLWQLRFKEISWGQDHRFKSGPSDPSLLQPQLESSLSYPKCASKRAAKWDRGSSKGSDDIYRFYHYKKLLNDCQVTEGSVVSTLNAELTQARLCIRDLEAKRKSFKKKVKHFLRKLEEGRSSLQSREREKNHVIEDLKGVLGRERKSRQKMENLNTNLVKKLAGAKFSAEQFMEKYEEEKKCRKLMEDIANELAGQIGEDKVEFEALKRESIKVLEEAEEERKMLHIAEVLREERIQMKLMDAKLALEDKYCQLNKLITDVETLIRSRFGTLDMMELRNTELILQAVKSLNIHDIEEFSYVPPKSDDILSVIEELRPCEGNERKIEPCVCHTPSHDSKVRPVSPEDNGKMNCLNGYSNCLQEDAEDQGSCDSIGGRGGNPSISGFGQAKNVLRSRSKCNDNAGEYSDREISEACSTSDKQSYSTSKLWRSCPSNGEVYKIAVDENERRLSNGIASSWGTKHRDSVGQWIATDTVNPHITRGMKGCIAWPRAIQKNGSKMKLLETKIESQKSQLRTVLKQKIR